MHIFVNDHISEGSGLSNRISENGGIHDKRWLEIVRSFQNLQGLEREDIDSRNFCKSTDNYYICICVLSKSKLTECRRSQ